MRTLITALALPVLAALNPETNAAPPQHAPEFTTSAPEDWLNTEPLSLAKLKGKVVLLDFWTFECWNCYRSFPWLNVLEASLADEDFVVIGVHSPEFDHEKDRDAVAAHVEKFKLRHPVMIDNDFEYWRALDNRYWPAFYLIDGDGRIRATYVGETHAGDAQARRIERDIRALLGEGAGG